MSLKDKQENIHASNWNRTRTQNSNWFRQVDTKKQNWICIEINIDADTKSFKWRREEAVTFVRKCNASWMVRAQLLCTREQYGAEGCSRFIISDLQWWEVHGFSYKYWPTPEQVHHNNPAAVNIGPLDMNIVSMWNITHANTFTLLKGTQQGKNCSKINIPQFLTLIIQLFLQYR